MSVEAMSLVLNHSRARGTDKVILLGIANHDGDGGSWPSMDTLARYANVSRTSARAAVRRLEEAGEIQVVRNAGGTQHTRDDRRPNLYRITTKPHDNGGKQTDPRAENPVADGGKPTGAREMNGGKLSAPTGVSLAPNGGKPTYPEPYKELTTEPPKDNYTRASARETPPTPTPTLDLTTDPPTLSLVAEVPAPKPPAEVFAFDDFWRVYPRKADKRSAEKAWTQAVTRAKVDAALVIAAAERYRDDPNRVDEFTKYPGTWLRAGSWDNDPLPARGVSNPRGPMSAGQRIAKLTSLFPQNPQPATTILGIGS